MAIVSHLLLLFRTEEENPLERLVVLLLLLFEVLLVTPPFCPPFPLLHAVVVVVKEEDEEAIIIIIIQIENVCLSNSLSNSLSNNNNNIYTIPERDNDEEERGERKTRECFDLFCFFFCKTDSLSSVFFFFLKCAFCVCVVNGDEKR